MSTSTSAVQSECSYEYEWLKRYTSVERATVGEPRECGRRSASRAAHETCGLALRHTDRHGLLDESRRLRRAPWRDLHAHSELCLAGRVACDARVFAGVGRLGAQEQQRMHALLVHHHLQRSAVHNDTNAVLVRSVQLRSVQFI